MNRKRNLDQGANCLIGPAPASSRPGAKKLAILLAAVALLAWGTSQWADSYATSAKDGGRLHGISPAPGASTTNRSIPLRFELNGGQFEDGVKAVCRTSEGTFYLTGDGSAASGGSNRDQRRSQPADTPSELALVGYGAVRMLLVGARADVRPIGLDPLPGTSSYFIGSDRAKWRTGVRTFGRLRCENIYPGIDMVLGPKDGHLEYDFVVAPGQDSGQIVLEFSGISALTIDESGELSIGLQEENLRHLRPTIYQTASNGRRNAVSGGYVLDGANRVRFEVGEYDRSQPLTIDPVIEFSTYLGGTGGEGAWDIAADASGNAYVTGCTASLDFPLRNPLGPRPGKRDVFVTKLNATAIIYSIYVGGAEFDKATAIAVDSSGSVYLAGETWSRDFPTVQPIQSAIGALPDAFVLKLNPAGTQIIYSTFLGGSAFDKAHGIAVDSSGSAFVTGTTWSTDFPTASPIQAMNAGKSDTFVAKLSPTGTSLAYSTYIGGTDADNHNDLHPDAIDKRMGSVAVDAIGNAFVTGCTASPDFPVSNAVQDRHQGGVLDAFIFKLNATGGSLLYSTFLGGSGFEIGLSVAVDAYDNAYVTGFSSSQDLRTTPAAFNPRYGGGVADAFVAKLDSRNKRLVYYTYLGGQSYDEAHNIAVDAEGNAYVTGTTQSSDFPVKRPFQSTYAGLADAFVIKLNPTGSSLIYASFLGGSGTENFGLTGDLAIDPLGDVYVTGATNSFDLPMVNPLQSSNMGGDDDVFVFRISDRQPKLRARMGRFDYRLGDTIVATELRIVNPKPVSVPARLLAWLSVPGLGDVMFFDMGSDGSFVLPANFDMNVGPVQFFTISEGFHIQGEWGIGTQTRDPVNGTVLSEGLHPFVIY